MDIKPDESKDLNKINVPLAYVKGEPYLNIPKDLYLPPDALEVVLESFEGTLDLLLYLIKARILISLNCLSQKLRNNIFNILI